MFNVNKRLQIKIAVIDTEFEKDWHEQQVSQNFSPDIHKYWCTSKSSKSTRLKTIVIVIDVWFHSKQHKLSNSLCLRPVGVHWLLVVHIFKRDLWENSYALSTNSHYGHEPQSWMLLKLQYENTKNLCFTTVCNIKVCCSVQSTTE